MSQKDKVLLLNKVEETLRPRMFANLLDEAVEQIQEHLDEFDVSFVGDGTPETDDFLDMYIDAKRVSGRSEKTLVRYRYLITRFMNAVNVKTRDVTPHHVREYFAKELERGVSESTLEGVRQVIHTYFDWLDHEKLISHNPLSNIEAIKSQKKERLALSDTDIELLKRTCKKKRDVAILCFLLASGCRISEVINLNRSDVDLDRGEFVVLGKGNKERTAFLDEVAILTLREYLATRSDDDPALFLCQRGRLQPGGVRVMLKELAEQSGVDGVHPHRFRRTLITRLLNRGMPIQEVAILAGHEKLDTTMKYFSASKSKIKSSYRLYTA